MYKLLSCSHEMRIAEFPGKEEAPLGFFDGFVSTGVNWAA
jgi:hypothetical protein